YQRLFSKLTYFEQDLRYQHSSLAQAKSTAAAGTLQQATANTPEQGQNSAATNGPLHVDSANPRYFADAAGQVVYLTGSHTWSNLQDNGGSDPPPIFDYPQYLDFLQANNHNFFRLWTWEEA